MLFVIELGCDVLGTILYPFKTVVLCSAVGILKISQRFDVIIDHIPDLVVVTHIQTDQDAFGNVQIWDEHILLNSSETLSNSGSSTGFSWSIFSF